MIRFFCTWKLPITKLIESDPLLKAENILKERLLKLIPEIQPSPEVRNGIFSYIMDEKIREKKEQEKIAAAFAEKEKQEKGE